MSAPRARPGGETVILVEDSQQIRDLTLEYLESLGYTVHAAEGGEAALAIAGELATVDLLLSDVVMPGLGAAEVASRLRQLHPQARVVYMSGFTGDPDLPLELGGDAFLEKPFVLQRLAEVMREVLDRPAGTPGAPGKSPA